MKLARSLIAFVVLMGLLQACRAPATQILLTVDSDIARPLTLRAVVFEGTLSPADASSRARSIDDRGSLLGAPVRRFPLELGIVPKEGSLREGPITVVLRAYSAAAAGQPELSFDRPLQMRFVPGTRQNARVVLRFACSTEVTGCVTPNVRCTLAQRCAETGRVCNDDAECGSPIVPQQPHAPDASVDVHTDSGVDARVDASTDAMMDSPVDSGPSLLDLAPRPIAPLSTARVSSRRPTLRWELPMGVREARVQLCRDRGCFRPIVELDGTTSARPTTELPHGWVFWRVRARSGAAVGSNTSPTWQFWVGARSANDDRDTSYGTIGDFNGDGFADLVVGTGSAGGTTTGSVRVYHGSAAGISTTPSQTITWMTANGFGKSVTSAGDVNGDGFCDLVVGAWRASFGARENCGAVLVYHGSPTGLSTTPALVIEGNEGEQRFGMSVAGVGDINGDGYGDIVAGGPYQNTPGESSGPGIIRVFFGSASGINLRSELNWRLRQPGDWFGAHVAGLGDVNGDGFADFSAWAPYADSGGLTNNGQGLIVFGAPSYSVVGPGIEVSDGRWVSGTRDEERFGTAHSAGDLDGDGFCDVAIVGDARQRENHGQVSLYRGNAMGLQMTPVRTIEGAAPLDQLGFSTALSNDLDDDGFDDLVLGAPTANLGGVSLSGYVLIFRGSINGVGPSPSLRIDPSPPSGSLFGFSVATPGDFNGDAVADLSLSEAYANVGGRMQAGRAHVHYGARGAMPVTRGVSLDGATAGDSFGFMIGR